MPKSEKIEFMATGSGENGAVCAYDHDGAYLNIRGDKAQIIVIGPMQGQPSAYELALMDETGLSYEIESAEFMKPPEGDEYLKRLILRRGMLSLIFKRDKK